VSQRIPTGLRERVLAEAGGRCAYCRSAEALLGMTFEVDHIIPQSTGGETNADNLCLSCPSCNRYKAARQMALDPLSGEMTPLYHPVPASNGFCGHCGQPPMEAEITVHSLIFLLAF